MRKIITLLVIVLMSMNAFAQYADKTKDETITGLWTFDKEFHLSDGILGLKKVFPFDYWVQCYDNDVYVRDIHRSFKYGGTLSNPTTTPANSYLYSHEWGDSYKWNHGAQTIRIKGTTADGIWQWAIKNGDYNGSAEIFSINNIGSGRVGINQSNPSEALDVNGSILVNNGWLRVKGQQGLYFQDYGGGFYMIDNSWIRTYGSKNFYHNSGIMRTDGTFQVGSGGGRFIVNSAGEVGIGQSSPNAALDIKKDGVALEIDHVTSGGSAMIKFNSVVNNGSDKGFILFQDESANCKGAGSEDVRLTMGVFNDFRASSTHSDELWLQGGGRLVNNVGNWDAELNTLIGTPSTGTTGGYEWRVNNTEKMTLSHEGLLSVNGSILADEIKVEDIAAINMNLSGDIAANNITIKTNGQTADFVFEPGYQLKDLSEVETFIKTNKHLENIPSATEMEEQGVNLAEMNKLLLQKIEELTLYAIEKDKEVQRQKLKVAKLEEDQNDMLVARKKETEEREKLEKQLKDQHEDFEIMAERLAKVEVLLMKDADNK